MLPIFCCCYLYSRSCSWPAVAVGEADSRVIHNNRFIQAHHLFAISAGNTGLTGGYARTSKEPDFAGAAML